MSRTPDPLRLIVIVAIGIYASLRAVSWLEGDLRPKTAPVGTAIVEGTVLGRNNEPVELAIVRVWNEEMGVYRAATTDATGTFRLSALPGAMYRVTAAKRGYVSARLGVAKNDQTFTIRDGEIRPGITVELMLGSTVSGVVYDESGRPASGRYVRVLRKVPADRPTFVDAAELGTTDAGGRYIIAGVAAGDVYVMASLSNGFGDRVYFPGARRVVDAEAVTLEPGEARTNLDLQAPPLMQSAIVGVARSGSGDVLASTRLTLVPASAGEPDERHLETGTRGDGSFIFDRVPADTYWITAQAPDALSRRQLWGAITVTSDGRAPLQTSLALTPGHAIVGRVIVRPSGAVAPLPASAVPVRLVPDDARTKAVMRSAYPRVLARADGEFTFDGIPPGRYRLDATVDRPWMIDRSPAGLASPGAAFDVVAGRPVTGLVLAVTDVPVTAPATAANRR